MAVETEAAGSVQARPEATPAGSAQDPGALRVAWLGQRPAWLDQAPAEVLAGTLLAPLGEAGPAPHVIHATAEAVGELRALKRRLPGSRIVLDVSSVPTAGLGRRFAAQAGAADLVLVGSLFDLRELRRRAPRLASRSALFREPLDVERWSPEARLLRPDSRELRLFRRHHRLVDRAVLFAGPYTPDGGLDVAIAAMGTVRRDCPGTRLLAVPLGAVAPGFRDRCERAVLGLGHHAVVEWAAPPVAELPLWLACADVVCLPARDTVPPRAAWLAAAAGKPVVASDVPQLLEHVDDGSTGLIVPAGDAAALAAALDRLLADPGEASRLGTAARGRVEAERSPAAAARELRMLWASATTERRQATAASATTGTAPWPGRVDESPSTSR